MKQRSSFKILLENETIFDTVMRIEARGYIRKIISSLPGHKSKIRELAEYLGMEQSRCYRLLKDLGIEVVKGE